MGIFEFLKKKNNNQLNEEQKAEERVEEREASDSSYENEALPLTMVDFNNVDWSKFGAILKREKLLPPSYDKKPTSVEISLAKDKLPKVELIFSSKTTDNTRKILIHDDEIWDMGNSFSGNTKFNMSLQNAWWNFAKTIRESIEDKKDKDVLRHINEGYLLIDKASALIAFNSFFEKEDKFLREHANTTFKDMYSRSFETMDGMRVYPFSPRTLELCVSRLNPEAKRFESENLGDFVSKCRSIEIRSNYQTKDWDAVIKLMKNMLNEMNPQKLVEDEEVDMLADM